MGPVIRRGEWKGGGSGPISCWLACQITGRGERIVGMWVGPQPHDS